MRSRLDSREATLQAWREAHLREIAANASPDPCVTAPSRVILRREEIPMDDFDRCAGCGKRILLDAPERKCARCRGVRDDEATPRTEAVEQPDDSCLGRMPRKVPPDPRRRHARPRRS